MTDCASVREMAPELALGQAPGEERATALAHMATCIACRRYVEDLARAADALLTLAPEAEPSSGFESRVLERVRPRRARIERRWIAAALVAAVVAGLGSWAIAARAYRLDRNTAAAFRTLGGRELRAASVHSATGGDVGHVVAYDGKPSWIFLWIKPDGAEAGSAYTIELAYDDRNPRLLEQTVQMTRSGATWGGLVRGGLGSLRAIRLRNGSGSIEFTATFV